MDLGGINRTACGTNSSSQQSGLPYGLYQFMSHAEGTALLFVAYR